MLLLTKKCKNYSTLEFMTCRMRPLDPSLTFWWRKNVDGVFSTFESRTSKTSFITPKPESASVLGNKLHAWYVKAGTPTMNILDPWCWCMSWYPTGHSVKIYALQGEKILYGCHTKIPGKGTLFLRLKLLTYCFYKPCTDFIAGVQSISRTPFVSTEPHPKGSTKSTRNRRSHCLFFKSTDNNIFNNLNELNIDLN